MKGLLAKDYALFMQRKKIFILFLAIAAGMAFFANEVLFAAGWLAMIGGIFSVSTISYDEYDNSMPFLMTMPVSGKVYAAEKYVFLLICSVGVELISVVILVLSSIMKEDTSAIAENIAGAGIILCIVLIFVSITLPAVMKWGAEKGRLIMLALAGAVFFLVYLLAQMYDGMSMAYSVFNEVGLYTIAGLTAAATAAVMVISAVISIRIMEKREY